MKKNKRLLYILGNAPDKYIDEAMSDKARKARLQWKYIITAAACFVIIAAVPVYMMKKSLDRNGSNGNGDITVTKVSEVTSESQTDVTTEQTKQTEPTPQKNVFIAGTGPEKPSDYKPDINFSRAENFGFEDGYFVVSFLKDKEFEESINADIREAADSLKPYFDKKYTEFGHTPVEDYNSWTDIKTTNGLTIYPSCKNGYLSIVMGYTSQISSSFEEDFLNSSCSQNFTNRNFEHAVSLTYDLFEQRKIEKFSDLFYNGEDVLSLINKSITDYIENSDSLITSAQKKKFDGLAELPDLFTFDTFIFNPDNQFFNAAPMIECSTYFDNRIYDHMIVGKYRDMKEIVDESCAPAFDIPNSPEWTYNKTGYSEQEGNFTVHYSKITESRFHTDDEVNEYIQTCYDVQHKTFEYLRDNYNPEDLPDIFVKSENGYDVFINKLKMFKSPYLKNTYTVRTFYCERINIDINTNKLLTLSDIFGDDWKENAVVPDYMESADLKNTNNDCQLWEIGSISDGSANISIPKGDELIWLKIPIDKINPDYFNTDYEEDKKSILFNF